MKFFCIVTLIPVRGLGAYNGASGPPTLRNMSIEALRKRNIRNTPVVHGFKKKTFEFNMLQKQQKCDTISISYIERFLKGRFAMKKRIIGLFLAIVMLLSLVPLTAFAGEDALYPLWVSGIQVTESNKSSVFGNSSVTFDPEKGILTLNNATFSNEGSASGFNYGMQCVCAVKSELDKLTVKLIGKSQIGKEVDSESLLEDYSIDIGFACSGDIAFIGDDNSSLTVYDYGAGIRAKNVTFGEDFCGKLTVRDCGGPEPQPPCAINAFCVRDEQTFDYISDGTVSILGGTFDIESFESNGVAADGNVIIKNAKFTSVADYDAIRSEYGNITIKDSDITVVGDTAISTYDCDILIENSNLKVTSTVCEGINGRDISLIGCDKVEINSTEDGLYSGRKVSIINCPDVVIDCNELTGICGNDILIDNSRVDVTAHDGSGIRADFSEDGDGSGNITVKDSTANIYAKRNGIDCNSLTVIGGKTNIYSAGDIDGKGCGAYINGDESAISVSGSTVKFTGGEAAIKLEKSSATNPFNGTLPNASFKGNTAYDTFTAMEAINYKSEKRTDMADEFFEIAYVGDEIAKSASVMHSHKAVRIDGKPATESSAGFKEYYKCDCGKFFEDANCNKEITDIEKWKAEGGNGYLPKLDSKPTSEPTGDSNTVIWAMLVSVAFIGLVSCGIGKKRKNA